MENFLRDISQPNLSKPSKLKAFRTVQKYLAIFGISPKLVTQSYPLNKKISLGFLLLGSATISICVYILNDANTFLEFTKSIYFMCVAIFFIAQLLTIILNVDTLFEYMERSNSMLNTSKWTF